MAARLGPFTVRHVRSTGAIDISLTAFQNSSFGWEYGWADPTGSPHPWIFIRLGKLVLLSFEKFRDGFEVWFLGFWWIK